MVKSISVVDANGDQLTVYMFQTGRFLSRVRSYQLCTGEAVEVAESDTFRIIGSGEELLRL